MLEPAHGHGDGRSQVGLLERLEEAGQDVLVGKGTPEGRGVVIPRQQNDRSRLAPADLLGGSDAVQIGQLDLGEDEIGPQEAALFDQLPSRMGHADFVAEAGKNFLMGLADGRVVVRNGNVEGPHLASAVRRSISGWRWGVSGPVPTAVGCRPWGLHDRLLQETGPMDDGLGTEVGIVGDEGVADISVFLGSGREVGKVFCQVPGEALRMKAKALREETRGGSPLNEILLRYTQALLVLVSQSTACNRLHTTEERLSRWLLMTHDRVRADQFAITQDFMADMLGVRRPTVSLVASTLQKAGLIRYSRGKMTILDRPGLEAAACECYAKVVEEYNRLLG